MISPLPLRLLEWWRENKNAPIPLYKALIFFALSAVLAFLVGRWHPEEDYRRLDAEAAALRADIRALAAAHEAENLEMRRLRLEASLGEKAAEKFRKRIEQLTADNLRWREEASFYRRLLGAERQSALNVYALEETPDFHPDHRRFSAVLIFPQTEFRGGYYFEAVARAEDGRARVVRAPPEGVAPLDFNVYGEIEQTVALPSGEEVVKLRLVVENEKGEVEAEGEVELIAGI